MLIGNAAQADETANLIFEAGTADFEQKVLRASMEKPVIADFWAPWCGPCKQLGPMLEAEVKAAKGAVVMAKINMDDNPQLAQALQIQSLPTVYGFYQGRPVDGFMGARPQSELKDFVRKLVALAGGDAVDLSEILQQADQLRLDGDLGTAQGLYGQILQQDPNHSAAYAGLMRCFLDANLPEQLQSLIENAPDEIVKSDEFAAVQKAFALKQQGSADLKPYEEKLQKNPQDHQARFDLACALFSAGREEEAMDALLEIIADNRAWEEDKARLKLLEFFDALGFTHPLSVAGRRKLSTILFS